LTRGNTRSLGPCTTYAQHRRALKVRPDTCRVTEQTVLDPRCWGRSQGGREPNHSHSRRFAACVDGCRSTSTAAIHTSAWRKPRERSGPSVSGLDSGDHVVEEKIRTLASWPLVASFASHV
jgi:hypothetical protein